MGSLQRAGGAAGGKEEGAALALATIKQLKLGAVHYDLSVPVHLLHPASALQLYDALPGACLCPPPS